MAENQAAVPPMCLKVSIELVCVLLLELDAFRWQQNNNTTCLDSLKNFARGEQVYVYDKSSDKRFRTNIKNIAAETGFYDLEVDADILTPEPALAQLEANTSTVIRKIVEAKSLRVLETNDIAVIAAFLAVQFVRIKVLPASKGTRKKRLAKKGSLGRRDSKAHHWP
jgi:hypothetical protein